MNSKDPLLIETFSQEETFRFVRPEDFDSLGIDSKDIPLGTFVALKHPSYLSSAFGGNAYGFGLVEVYHRLSHQDIKLFQDTNLDNPREVAKHYKEINQVYKRLGLLIRFSSLGKPYYLIPVHLVSKTLSHIKTKVEEIGKVIAFHRKKYLKEHQKIGLFTHADDLIINELNLQYREHHFLVIDSIHKIEEVERDLDLVILTRDPYEIVLMDDLSSLKGEIPSKKTLDQYAIHLLWNLYNLINFDGEIFVIANHYTPKTNRTTKLIFKNHQEEKNFMFFTHIFKTKKRYHIKDHKVEVNLFDLQKYLSGVYVEQETMQRFLNGKHLDEITADEIQKFPYADLQIPDHPSLGDQDKNWSRLFSIFFEQAFLRPLIPEFVRKNWEERFESRDYTPRYMIRYIGQKKPLSNTFDDIMSSVMYSNFAGCSPDLLAEYLDSFEHVIRTLQVVRKLKSGKYQHLPQVFVDRLKQPLETKGRRFEPLNEVIRLSNKIGKMERIKGYVNPDKVQGHRTPLLANIEIFNFFGFDRKELEEISLIALGHTSMGRILAGKMNEKSLRPVSDLAKAYDHQQATNLLRYVRLMTMAELEASRGSPLPQAQVAELFDLYESAVRVAVNRELDWETLLEEKTASLRGVRNKVVRKLLKMLNYFEFLDNWAELSGKGKMEKEAIADYDEGKFARIENVIRLVNTIERFEKKYLASDPFQLTVFYRKILDIEFHGTGHLAERLDTQSFFTLLWIVVNVAKDNVINFNPLLSDLDSPLINERTNRIERHLRSVNLQYLDLPFLHQFRRELYEYKSSFIIGTGFQLTVDGNSKGLTVNYIDMDKTIEELESLVTRLSGLSLYNMPLVDLKAMEGLFYRLESFYQSHLRVLNQKDFSSGLPKGQKTWYQRSQKVRKSLKDNFLDSIFSQPGHIYTNLNLLYKEAPLVLGFILPELAALEDVDLSGDPQLESPVIPYIINTAWKLQALVRHEREGFQDTTFLHDLAQKEFGPMATGTVGLNESQLIQLEEMLDRLSHRPPIFSALVASIIFQSIGRLPSLREAHKDKVNLMDLGSAGALFLEEEKILEKYPLDAETRSNIILFVRHHCVLCQIVKGEISFAALQDLLWYQDKDLFDAMFLLSLIVLSSTREDLILEDTAKVFFQVLSLGHRIMAGTQNFQSKMTNILKNRGTILHIFENRCKESSSGVITSAHIRAPCREEDMDTSEQINSGKIVFGMERLFRLRGIRQTSFLDLANFILKTPLEFIYKKRGFSSVGYATFEREVFESLRIYNALQKTPREIKNFILDFLVGDRIRIFGYEKTSNFLTYENQVKLLLLVLLCSQNVESNGAPVFIDLLELAKQIDKRYEAVNDYLVNLSIEKVWSYKDQVETLFKRHKGFILEKDLFRSYVSLHFHGSINISRKLSYMESIRDIEQLRNYYHYSLRALRKHPFYTDDYEIQLEKAFEKRQIDLTETLLNQAKEQISLIEDFKKLHNLISDFTERSWEIGFSDSQMRRLSDLYEMRKDVLRRKKISEIESALSNIHDRQELSDYWDSIKCYLESNRPFFGKDSEILVARRFDLAMEKIEGKRVAETTDGRARRGIP